MFLNYPAFDHQSPDQHHEQFHFNIPKQPYRMTVGPTTKELDLYAMEIQKLFKEGIFVRDLPIIIKLSSYYLEYFSMLKFQDKSCAIMHILNYVINHSKTPFSDSYKSFLPYIVELLLPESLGEFPDKKISAVPTDELMRDYAEDVFELFEKTPFQEKDAVFIIKAGITFANQFENLHLEEKKILAKKFVSYVIDNVDTSHLSKDLSDEDFKDLSFTSIDIILDQLLIRLG